MDNSFQKAQKDLEASKCPTCKGLGELDDSALGDMYYNTWKCPECKGSGIKESNNG